MKKLRYPILILWIVIDQIVKFAIKGSMIPGESHDVIGKIFSITFVRNTGAAFGILAGKSALLIIVPIVAAAICIFLMEKYQNESHWTLPIALSCVAAGGIGNVIDRAFVGYVTDMFDVHFWPVFNVADISVCVGCGLIVIYVLFFDKDEKKDKVKAASEVSMIKEKDAK